MSVQTSWGYSVESLEPVMTVEAFRELCPNMASTDEQIAATIMAVSESVRDYCGWHVAPSLECTYKGEGEGRLLVLPAMGVTDVSSLTVEGRQVTGFEWKPSGLVRLTRGCFPDKWGSVACTYTAGFAPASVGQVVAQIAANSLAASPGVSDERAGNVSITYNRTGDGITGGVSLLDRDMAQLSYYRLARAW